jgi:hypothetical protein
VERSDNWIAGHIGCNHVTVKAVRERLESASEIQRLDEFLGEDSIMLDRAAAQGCALDVVQVRTPEVNRFLHDRERVSPGERSIFEQQDVEP